MIPPLYETMTEILGKEIDALIQKYAFAAEETAQLPAILQTAYTNLTTKNTTPNKRLIQTSKNYFLNEIVDTLLADRYVRNSYKA